MTILRPHSPQLEHRSQQLRQELVSSLVQSGALSSSAIEHAFLTVPREAFVPFFYEQDERSKKMAWNLIAASQLPYETYLEKVYRDQPLITKVDVRQLPVSSSSMPSAMAKMLEALDIQEGQRVLEIGTGSGYNAALMASIAGNPECIVSIEYDASLAQKATQAIEHVLGRGVTVSAGDGFPGYPEGAPYDRILATASVPTLPVAWVQQLRTGGKIVMDLQGSLSASGFLVVEKTADGYVTGHFLANPLHFMPLVSKEYEILSMPSLAHLSQQDCYKSFVVENENIVLQKLFDMPFRWFLQWRLLHCQISKRKHVQRETGCAISSIVVSDPTTKVIIRFQQQAGKNMWKGDAYGNFNMWEVLQNVYSEFLSLGEPQPDEYHLIVEQDVPLLVIGAFKFPI